MSNNFLDDGSLRKGESKYGYSARKYGSRRPQKRSGKRIAFIVIADILLVGAGLIIFALFHHVLPRGGETEAIVLPTPSAAQEMAAAQESVYADNGDIEADTAETMAPADQGMWGAKFADKFTDGDVIKTENSYKSHDINVAVEQVQGDGITYYVADIYVRSLQNFKTAFASGEYVKKSTMEGGNGWTLDIANVNDAVVAISGDYYNMRAEGIVIRNGALYRQEIFEDILIMYNDGSMQTFSPNGFDMDAILENGAYQGWSFGPFMLQNGQAMEKGTFNSSVNPANPRSAIGYFEPGHYCFVLVDGRQPGYSNGMTLEGLSKVFYDLGCTVAYNLDGGQSAAMAFDGALENQPYDGGREMSDIIYIAEVTE